MPIIVTGVIGTALAAVGLVPIAAASQGPFGRLNPWVTAGVTVVSLTFAFLTHVGAFGWHSDPFIDLVASIAVGVVFGRGAGLAEGQTAVSSQLADSISTLGKLAVSAHDRLDRLNAPAVPFDHAGTSIGTAPTREV